MSIRAPHRRFLSSAEFPRNQDRGDQSWMTSYADITTALMCFFLIFFASSNIQQDENIVDSLVVSLNPNEKSKDLTSPVMNTPTLAESLSTLPGIFVTKGERSLTVDFDNGTFFNSASTQLTSEGKQNIEAFISKVEPFRENLFIEIRGHSDNVPVVYLEGRRFKNNTELSTLRALTVFKVFTREGFEPKTMAVSGFGASMTLSDKLGNENRSSSRRITFRITELESI